jgi:hypothetical protein
MDFLANEICRLNKADKIIDKMLPFLKKGMTLKFVEYFNMYESEDVYNVDSTHYYYSDVSLFKIIKGQIHTDSQGYGWIYEPHGTYEMRRILFSNSADNTIVYVAEDGQEDVEIWNSSKDFVINKFPSLCPLGLQKDAIEALKFKDNDDKVLPLKIIMAIYTRDNCGVNTLRETLQMDNETEKFVLKPLVWWI